MPLLPTIPVATYNARFVKLMNLPLAQILQALLAYGENVGVATLDDLQRAPNAHF